MAPRIDRTFRLDHSDLQKIEDTLADQPWLAGDTYSLADIAVTPYVNRLDTLGMWKCGSARVRGLRTGSSG